MIELYGHPFSSYTWKVLIALYENDTPFTFRMTGPDQPDNEAVLARDWLPGKFPLLVDDGRPVPESSAIIEHLDRHHPGAVRFVPADPALAAEVRLLDRVFDNQVMGHMQAIVAEHLPFITASPDPNRVARARDALDQAYRWLDARLAGRRWAAGDDFTLADCAGAPSLFYADWVHPIDARFAAVKAYRARVLARPSVTRCVDEARPYRHFFPLGAPDRD